MSTVSVETLFVNKWVSVVERTMSNGGKYVHTTSPWSGSKGVAILPFRRWIDFSLIEMGIESIEYLGRYEVCPAHSDIIELCSITGGMDKEGELPIYTAVRELHEEAGYIAEVEEMISLGSVRGSKSSETETFLFAVDVTGKDRVEAIGDGTIGEEGALCDWVSYYDAILCKDPLVATMISRLVIIPANKFTTNISF